MGWALGNQRLDDEELDRFKSQIVSDLISPEHGIRPDISPSLDLALHDLMGVILDKPAYQLLEANGPKRKVDT